VHTNKNKKIIKNWHAFQNFFILIISPHTLLELHKLLKSISIRFVDKK